MIRTTSLILLVLWLAPVARASAPGRFTEQAIRTDRDGQTAPATRPVQATTAGSQLDWPRVLISLGLVIGLIVVMRLAMKKWLGVGGVGGAGRSVKVLGRTMLGPRQQVLLIQVGRRVVVTADSGGQLSALAQITDPDEVASLIGAVESPVVEGAPSGVFARMFGAARQPFGGGDLDSVDDTPAPIPAGGVDAIVGDDREVDAARGELAGLMERVRGLSRQFRRSS